MTEGSFSAKKKERVAMKRRYQIDPQRAVQQFRQLAREENPSIQMIFPMAEVVGLLQEGVGHLLREAGLALMNLVMEEEVRHLAGERHQQHPERRAHRWGKEDGYCTAAATVLSAADFFLVDKLLKGWKPNQFIEGSLKQFLRGVSE
jgi:hypothetical protein